MMSVLCTQTNVSVQNRREFTEGYCAASELPLGSVTCRWVIRRKGGKMRVLGYVRVSTEEQATNGQSLDAQRAKIEAYASLYDLELVGIIVDAGVSAKSLNRSGLRDALAQLRRGAAEGLVVAKLDQIGRAHV